MLVVVAVGVAGIVATGVTAWAVANSPIWSIARAMRSGGVRSSRCMSRSVRTCGGGAPTAGGPDRRRRWFIYAGVSLNASGAPLAYTLGMVVWVAMVLYVMYMYLCVPRGWLESLV